MNTLLNVGIPPSQNENLYLIYLITVLLFLTLLLWQRKLYRAQSVSYNKLQEKLADNDMLRIVASKVDIGMMICDKDGRIEWINDGMVRLLGYSLDEIRQVGTSLQEVSRNGSIKEIINQAQSEKKRCIYDALHTTKGGQSVWVQSTITPMVDNDTVVRFIIVTTDITDRKDIEKRLGQKNKKLTESINYAKRIQMAMLPTIESIQQHLPNSFVLYQPKDTVSGDFYCFGKKYGKIIVAIGDCTGHGVPSSLISMIAINFLNHLVLGKGIIKPNEILDSLHIRIRKAFKQNVEGSETQDGMDIGLIAIDPVKEELEFAGAMRNLYLIRKNESGPELEHTAASFTDEIEEIKGDRHSIGGRVIKREHVFTNHMIKINRGDLIYMFSDGYADQFGGKQDGKFLLKQLRDLLLDIQNHSMVQQKEILSQAINNWKGEQEQTDDILMMGMKF
jgi:PAS domain S-box-containing protein